MCVVCASIDAFSASKRYFAPVMVAEKCLFFFARLTNLCYPSYKCFKSHFYKSIAVAVDVYAQHFFAFAKVLFAQRCMLSARWRNSTFRISANSLLSTNMVKIQLWNNPTCKLCERKLVHCINAILYSQTVLRETYKVARPHGNYCFRWHGLTTEMEL